VTTIARRMVGRWGMSPEIGPLAVLDEDSTPYPFRLENVSPATMELVDRETRRIVDECYTSAVDTLKHHRHRLDALASALLDKETLEAQQAYDIAGLPWPGSEQ
jgi:cell division protease FtsH